MDNQAKDLKLEKDRTRLSETRKKSAKRELENAKKKKASSWRKQDPRIACRNFICSSFLNRKVDIFFVTLNKYFIRIKFWFASYSHLLFS